MLRKPAQLLVVSVLAAAVPAFTHASAGTNGDGTHRRKLAADYLRAPLVFEANQGRPNAQAGFLARGGGCVVFITPTEAVVSRPAHKRFNSPRGEDDPITRRFSVGDEQARPAVVRIRLVGANRRAQMLGLDLLPGRTSYFIGNDPAKWRRGVPNYARVRVTEVYPGVDLVYYGSEGGLEYDFVVRPGGRTERIKLAFSGVTKLSLDHAGNLRLGTPDGTIVQHRPVVYQIVDGTRKFVEGRYVVRGDTARFEVGRYDTARTLVIDPVLAYSTYLGGSGWDSAAGIAVDGSGSVWVTGFTFSADFPNRGGSPMPGPFPGHAFVTKLSPSGTLLYSTYLGGDGFDEGRGIAVDAGGNAYLTGNTTSTNFPTVSALQPGRGGVGDTYDAFVAKLSPAGDELLYSTYLGGNGNDWGSGIAVDASGDAYVTGGTSSMSFPLASPFQAAKRGISDCFIAKVNRFGSALIHSTYLGGSGGDGCGAIAVDASGSAYVAGSTSSTDFPIAGAIQPVYRGGFSDVFVAKLTPDGGALVYSTYLGGRGDEQGSGIAVDASGAAHVTGYTTSEDFPTVGAFQKVNGGAYDAFVTTLNPAGSALVYSTYLGGSADESARAVAIDATGAAYVTGYTTSRDFPIEAAFLGVNNGGRDAFLTKLSPTGAVAYSTYLGGRGEDSAYGVAVDGAGTAYVTGYTDSTDFPTVSPFQAAVAGGYDAFIAKIAMSPVTVAVSSSENPSSVGRRPTFTATVWGTSPTGTVQFKDRGANLGAPVPLCATVPGTAAAGALAAEPQVRPRLDRSSSIARYKPPALAAGGHVITAVYGGDARNPASSSLALTQTIMVVPTVTLTSSLNPAIAGQAVTFTATVSGASPTGSVQFTDDVQGLDERRSLVGGVAQLTAFALTVGKHAITATYWGDANNTPARSQPLEQIIERPELVIPALTGAGLACLAAVVALLGVALARRSVATFWREDGRGGGPLR